MLTSVLPPLVQVKGRKIGSLYQHLAGIGTGRASDLWFCTGCSPLDVPFQTKICAASYDGPAK
jgi:hypothetical protein